MLRIGGQVFGVLLVHSRNAGAFGATENVLFQDLANSLGYGVAALRTALNPPATAPAALTIGDYAAVDTGVANLFAYTRTHGNERLLVVLNFAGSTHRIDLSALGKDGEILLSTGMESVGKVRLRALYVVGNEGMVLRL